MMYLIKTLWRNAKHFKRMEEPTMIDAKFKIYDRYQSQYF